MLKAERKAGNWSGAGESLGEPKAKKSKPAETTGNCALDRLPNELVFKILNDVLVEEHPKKGERARGGLAFDPPAPIELTVADQKLVPICRGENRAILFASTAIVCRFRPLMKRSFVDFFVNMRDGGANATGVCLYNGQKRRVSVQC
ncbi:hypothetical protein M3Y99_01785200 [Aphelenchoides fujianensis]|nr:hypothetical protein M3Y99_01785200 [Aphelenchoides fujianensis]